MAYTISLVWLLDLLTRNGVGFAEAQSIIGLVSFAYLIGSAALSIPFGNLSDRFGRRSFAIIGCVVAGIALIILPTTGSLNEFNSILIGISLPLLAVGLGHATYTASTNAYVGDIASKQALGRAYGLVQLARFSSFSFGPALGGIVSTLIGRELTFITSGALLIGGGIAAAIGMPELRKFASIPKVLPTSGITHTSTAKIMAGHVMDMHGHDEHGHEAGNLKMFIEALKNTIVGAALVTTFFMAIGTQAFRTFVPTFGSRIGAPDFIIGAFISVEAAASIVAAIPVGKVVDATGRRMPLLVIGLLVAGFSLGLMFVIPETTSLVIWSLVFGVAVAMTRVSQAVMIAEKTSVGNRAATMGTNHAFEHAGYGIGALSGGFLIGTLGFVPAFRIFTSVLLIVAVGFFLFAQRKKIK